MAHIGAFTYPGIRWNTPANASAAAWDAECADLRSRYADALSSGDVFQETMAIRAIKTACNRTYEDTNGAVNVNPSSLMVPVDARQVRDTPANAPDAPQRAQPLTPDQYAIARQHVAYRRAQEHVARAEYERMIAVDGNGPDAGRQYAEWLRLGAVASAVDALAAHLGFDCAPAWFGQEEER